MKPRNKLELAALTERGQRLKEELGPKLQRFYQPMLSEPVPSSFLLLIDELQYAHERPRLSRTVKAA